MSDLANTLFPPPPDYYKLYTKGNEGAALDKPRADWIEEDGRWLCFGQEQNLHGTIQTAAEIGLPALIDPSLPPQETMPVLLDSFLQTMLLLIEALTKTARDPIEMMDAGWHHEGDQYIQHLSNLAATMMVMSNQLRSVQAEATLVVLMEKQLQERRTQTASLKE